MLTATQKLKQFIVWKGLAEKPQTPDEIDAAWERLMDSEDWGDAVSEVRSGEYATGLPCAYSRHYESRSVAAQMLDGSYVGWTYWFGGGKHGEPEAVPWIEDAYDVTMTEETRVVKVFRNATGP